MEFLNTILADTDLLEVLLVEVGLTSIEPGTNQTGNVSAHYQFCTVQVNSSSAHYNDDNFYYNRSNLQKDLISPAQKSGLAETEE